MSEALRLADLVEHDPLAYSDDAAAELRRLSAELAALKAAIEAQGVPYDADVWCEYVAEMVGAYISEPVGSEKVKAIAGIIRRRMPQRFFASAQPAPQAENVAEDAYNHACEEMERWQRERYATGKEVGTTGSLCDGIAWLYQYVDSLEKQASAVQQGPVAWIRPSGKAMLEAGGYCTVYASDGMSNHSTPLYTHPAKQAKPKPITEQELKAGREAVTDDPDEQPDPWSFRMGAWFAERHHGIKE